MIKMKKITDFQKKVYVLLKKVPESKITTYKEIGNAIYGKGKKKGRMYRAVGVALKKNPFAPEVPCHRVVLSNGNVGSYSGKGGVNTKIKLLKKEGVKINFNNKQLEKSKIIDFEKVFFRF